MPRVNFRLPKHLQKPVRNGEANGHSRTQVVVRMMEVGSDVAEEVGDDWWELEKRAMQEGSSPGRVAGKIVKAFFEAERKRR
jgi:hypothetical protein